MPEEVGNAANHGTDKTAPEINMGISLVATQDTVESDSFDHRYDENAVYPVADAGALIAAVADKNAYIALANDIDLGDTQLTIESDLVLNLNGHTLSASTTRMLYVKTGGSLIIQGDENSLITSTARRTDARKTASEAPLYITGGSVILEGGKILGRTSETNDAAIIVSGTQETATLEIRGGSVDAGTAPYSIRVGRVNNTKYGAISDINWEQAEISGKICGDGAVVGIDEAHKSLLDAETPESATINGITYYFVSEKSKNCTLDLLGQ